MKTTKEDMILPVRYYVPSAFSLNLYSNTIEQVFFFFFFFFLSFSPPLHFLSSGLPGYLSCPRPCPFNYLQYYGSNQDRGCR